MQDSIVEIKDVWFAYNGQTVLEDVSLDIRQGDFIAMIGPNGGGKTTLLKLMLGLLKPAKGSMTWWWSTGSFFFPAGLPMPLMAAVSLKAKHRADTIIGVIWALGMACGIILLDLTPGYNVDLMSYLFGSILTVPQSDLWIMLIVGALIVSRSLKFNLRRP